MVLSALPPLPDADISSAGFFAALAEHHIELQQCANCSVVQIARLTCDNCAYDAFDIRTAAGDGTIYSFTRIHLVYHPAFENSVPYAAGIVELDEGPRIFAPISASEHVRVGARVLLEFITFGDRAIPSFRAYGERR